jgi:hypothetical protein
MTAASAAIDSTNLNSPFRNFISPAIVPLRLGGAPDVVHEPLPSVRARVGPAHGE